MPKIFLDYGHGGEDPGAISGSFKEKDFNFSVGERVKYHLQRHNQEVILSRSTDINPSLSERSNKANINNVDICVSIHCNSFSDPSAQGVEIYTYGVGSREIGLANELLNSVIRSKLYTKNRGVKQADLHMVREVQTASVLLEMGFITNDQDLSIIKDNIEEMAIAITKGILLFYQMTYRNETTSTTGSLYKVQVGAFSNKKYAEYLALELRSKGYNTYITQ